MRPTHLALLLGLNCGWATMPSIANRLEDQLGPTEFVLLRYGLALAGLLLVWPWLPGRIPRGWDFWRTCVMGVAVFNVGHICQVSGMQLSQASDSSILLALDPLVSTLAAAVFLHERIPGRRWAGFGLAILGVVWMSVGHSRGAVPGILANLLIVVSFAAEAVWSVMGKPLIPRWGIPKVTALALAAGTLANLVTALLSTGSTRSGIASLSFGGWMAMAFLGIGLTAFGYSAWLLVIREAPVSLAAMTIYLQPVVGTLVAVLATGESLRPGHAWGSLTILAGLVLGFRTRTPGNSSCRAHSP